MGIFDAIRKQVQSEAKAAMVEAENKGFRDTQIDVSKFYGQGDPIRYKRTGKLRNTPRSTGVAGGGNHYQATIYLDTAYEYETGTYTAQKVVSKAEVGGSGILGKPGFWEKSLSDIERDFYEALAKRFN